MDNWATVDRFSTLVSGPVWMKGQISDDDIVGWAQSDDLWWRRATLVSTTSRNENSNGDTGDARRTLIICEMLVADHEDMIVKALSWALRELIPWDRGAIEDFLKRHDSVIAPRVWREVRNKLWTGLKTPGQRA